ncbi:MAG: hypothetical protein Q8M19_27910 [Reyranella sp.]|nr:hypothetical protein [Reyranella sp.]
MSRSVLAAVGAALVILGVAGFVLPIVTTQETKEQARISAGLYAKK